MSEKWKNIEEYPLKLKKCKVLIFRFRCTYKLCDKFYGSDISLNLHIKLKHNGGNKSDRMKLAVNI